MQLPQKIHPHHILVYYINIYSILPHTNNVVKKKNNKIDGNVYF